MEKTKVVGVVLGLVTAVSVARAEYSFTYGGKTNACDVPSISFTDL